MAMLNLTVVDFNLKFRHFDQMFVMKFDLYSAKTHCMCWYQCLTCSAVQLREYVEKLIWLHGMLFWVWL